MPDGVGAGAADTGGDAEGERESDTGSEGVLTVATNVFEFVEVGGLESKKNDSSAWDFLTVGDLEEGKEYYIFLTIQSLNKLLILLLMN